MLFPWRSLLHLFFLHDYVDDTCLKSVKKLLPMKFMISDQFLITKKHFFVFRFTTTGSTSGTLSPRRSGKWKNHVNGHLLWQYSCLKQEACPFLFLHAAAVFTDESLEPLLSKLWGDIRCNPSRSCCIWACWWGMVALFWRNATGWLWFYTSPGRRVSNHAGKGNSDCYNI